MTTQRSWPTHNCMHLMLLIVHLHLVHTHILLLLLIGVHSLVVCWLCTCNWCCQLCMHHLLLLIAHTPHLFLLLIVHTHTHKLLVIVASVHTTYWLGVRTFCCWLWDFVDILLGRRKSKAFFCVCEVDSIGIVHIRTPLLGIYIATYLVLVIGACRTLTLKVLLDNHESMQNNELYDEWKSLPSLECSLNYSINEQ